MLDFKTYIAILEADLKTLRQFDPITVLDHPYTNFLEKELESNQKMTFRELDVI
jgi:hypothetical protein